MVEHERLYFRYTLITLMPFLISPQTAVALLLLLQAVLGAIDTFVNHEWRVRLPTRMDARDEVALHAVREATYALLFAGVAWLQWHGAWAWALGALPLVLIGIDLTDEIIENRTRILPHGERALHFLMNLNLGVTIAVMVLLIWDWGARPTALVLLFDGMLSWLLTAAAAGALCWSVRDALAWHALGHRPVAATAH